jgi:hypothetical protein
MERGAGYSVKLLSRRALAGARILINALQTTGNRKASSPEVPEQVRRPPE